jgi:transposase InsO family protein
VKFPKPINNERVLDRKAREYAATGLECLISGCFGNANREMISKAAHARLMELAAQPIKLSYEDVSMYFNQEAQETGAFQPMTVSAIKQHLNKLKHKRVWSYFRHGKLEADEIYQPEILRELPSFADALWSIDGTTMQIYYRDADGKMKSDLYVEFVTDVYSSAIIGYSVAFSETAGMVAEALKDAIDTHGYKPYQLQYDNSSANQQDAIQGIMNNMSRVHFGTKPYHGKSKYVETYIGHFQQRVLRKSEAFKGGNITAKSLNSKANADLLAKFKKHPELLLSESEVIAAFGEAVREWNARGQKRDKYGFFTGESKITRYETCANENRVKLNYLEKISLFMAELKKPYKYGKQGIRITLNGVKHNYIVPDTDNIGDFEFSRLYLGEEFTVRINPLAPDFITLWKNGVNVATAHEKEEYSSCIADLKKRGDGAKIKQFIAKQEEYGYQHAKKEMERQREILQSEGLRATGTDGFGWYDTDKTTFNIIQGIQEDVHNGIAETEEINPELRALLNM